ncbi:hypothetical protein [Streptomyces sclerotialus]
MSSRCAAGAAATTTTPRLGPGPLPHRTYAALMGRPLDGLLLDTAG